MPLGEQGYAGLAINTRQHDQAINTDNFFAVRNDLAAATAVARALGYQRVVLRGHSLGTVQVLYYAATDWSPEFRGVIRWYDEAAATSMEWIRRVPLPLVLVRDANDQIILPFELHQLYAAATAPGALSPAVEIALIPDSHPENGHQFPNTIPELTEVAVRWLTRLGL